MCVKCKHRVFFDPATKVLYYMDDGCNKVPVPADALVGGSPIGGGNPIPPPDPTVPPSSNNACYKANGAWAAIENFMEATFPIIDDLLNAIPLFGQTAAYIKFQRTHPEIDEDNAGTFAYFTIATTMGVDGINGDPTGITDAQGAKGHWEEHKETIKNDFICAMQDIFDKSDRLSDADVEAVFDYEFDTPDSAPYADKPNLDSLLHYAVRALEKTYYKKLAYAAVTSQEGECNCAGNEPAPEYPTAPPAGEFGFYPGVIVGQIDTTITPQQSLDHATPLGTKVSERNYDSEIVIPESGPDNFAYIQILFKATELVRQTEFNFLWQYTGSDPDATWWAYLGIFAFASTGINSNWVALPGTIAANSQQTPDWEPDAPSPLLPIAIPLQIVNADYEYIGIVLQITLGKANSGGANPAHIIRNLEIKAKATTGGNYRATLIPGQWQPKAL